MKIRKPTSSHCFKCGAAKYKNGIRLRHECSRPVTVRQMTDEERLKYFGK